MGSVKCLECGKILISRSRHDFVQCDCPNQTFVDGGDNYIRVGGIDLSKIEVLSDTNTNIVKTNKISGFFGKYRFLSNFFQSKIKFNGKTYKTAEHLYQSLKATNEIDAEKIRKSPSPSEAKKISRSIKIRDNWDSIKVGIMFMVIKLKFEQNKELALKLLNTKNIYLEETNNWNDIFWGVTSSGGYNILGNLLMILRKMLGGKNETGN